MMRAAPSLVLLCLALGWSHPGAAASAVPKEHERPNIILIIGDDHGYPDSGFMGSPHVKTPHLDRLAASGTLFTHGYTTSSICAPSLRSLLTGLHPYQWNARVAALREQGISREWSHAIQDFRTLPAILGEHGYASFQAGKLWEAHYEMAGFTSGMIYGERAAAKLRGARFGREGVRPAVDFIEANADRPFFLWFAPKLPHLPHNGSPLHWRPYQGKGLSVSALRYYGSISWFDEIVGDFLAYLESKDLTRRTVIVYVADNGWDQPPQLQLTIDRELGGDRGKLSMFDIGFRTPIVLSWPGHIRAGQVNAGFVSTVDLFPTLLGLAGIEIPPGYPGFDLRGTLERGAPIERSVVVGGMSRLRVGHGRLPRKRRAAEDPFEPELAFFLRAPGWRYIWNRDIGTERLYAIDDDPRELEDLHAEHPELTAQFKRQIVAWQERMRSLPSTLGEGARAPNL